MIGRALRSRGIFRPNTFLTQPGEGHAGPSVSGPPPRLVNTMDMLFDPYADGPFKAASRAATKAAPAMLSRAGSGGAPGGGPSWGGAPGGGQDGGHPGLPPAEALLEGLNPQQEEAVKHAGSP